MVPRGKAFFVDEMFTKLKTDYPSEGLVVDPLCSITTPRNGSNMDFTSFYYIYDIMFPLK